MRYTSIGSDKVRVPRIGVGSMGIGGYFSAEPSRDEEAIGVLRHAFDRGLTLVDTAEGYAAGHSEELVGKAVRERRAEIYIATKVSPEHLAERDLLASVEQSLGRLGMDRIDLLQVHWPNPKIPIEQTMRSLEKLVASGKVRHVGLSNFTLRELRDAQACLTSGSLAAVQVEYNLFDRSVEKEYLPYCRHEGIVLVAYSPLDQGEICGGPRRRALLEPIAQRHQVSLAQLALAWLSSQEAVVAIPKAAKEEHVDQNAAAADLELPTGDLAEISRLTETRFVEVPVDRIRVVPDDTGRRNVYRTVKEARENALGFSPSPVELAQAMRQGEFLKAVRVRPAAGAGYDFDLVEGRIRYWAWVIAYDGRRDIPVLVRE